MDRCILASASPRRRELLERMGLAFTVDAANIPEEHSLTAGMPRVGAEQCALDKARTVATRYTEPVWVLAADTIVVCHGEVLGKPTDADNARSMLRSLSGTTHTVITGVALVKSGGEGAPVLRRWSAETAVTFTALTDEIIDWYITTNEWRDKAGAYGIQGYGAVLVERIDGSYTNVVGLPLAETLAALREEGFALPCAPVSP